MSKPHAQRIAIATGWDIDDVRSFIDAAKDMEEPFETTADVIAAIEWDEQITAALDADIPFEHAMGSILGGMDY